MTKEWTFDQALDPAQAVESSSSSEERAKIAALFGKKDDNQAEEIDYVAAFEKEQEAVQKKSEPTPKVPVSATNSQKPNITKDYKQHLLDVMAQNNEDIALSQKKIEELHQLIDNKNQHNKKLQAISVAIDDL